MVAALVSERTMRKQSSSRLDRTVELGRMTVDSLVREPVKESVREALAEERAASMDQSADEPPVGASTRRDRRTRESRGRTRRSLGMRRLLPVLGLAAAAAIARWRRRRADDGGKKRRSRETSDRGSGGSTGRGERTAAVSDGGTSSRSGSAHRTAPDDGSTRDAE